MNYLEKLSCTSLAEHYAKFRNEEVLDELKRRDKLANKKAEVETDKQLFLEFASLDNSADTPSVKSLLDEAYEAGFQAGKKVGEKSCL